MMNIPGMQFLWLSTLLSFASPALPADLPAETAWADPSSVALNINFPGEGYHASWDLFRCDCGDLLVRAELAVPGELVRGDLLLVDGRAVLTRGFDEYRDQAAASLDAAALMMQLALRLLERSEPGGPGKITGTRDVDLLDEINHINLDTGGAVGGFRAPWSIRGKIWPDSDTARRFDLRFYFTVFSEAGPQQGDMTLRGVAEYADTEFPVPGSSALDGWNLSWRNEEDGVSGKAETLDGFRKLLRGD